VIVPSAWGWLAKLGSKPLKPLKTPLAKYSWMARASAADQLVIAVTLQEADGDVVEPLLAVARHRQPTLAGS
jgi:hypothetical protein